MKTLQNQMKIYLRCIMLMGQFPFNINEGELTPSTVLRIYGLVISGSLTSLAIVYSISVLPQGELREGILRSTFFAIELLLIVTTTLIPIFKSTLYQSIFQRLNKIERYLIHLGRTIDEKKTGYLPLLSFLKQLVLMATLIGIDFAMPYWKRSLPIHAMVYYWISTLFMAIVTVNCETFSYLLTARYDIINSELENLQKKLITDKIFAMDKIFNKHLTKPFSRPQYGKIFPTLEYRLTKLQNNKDVLGQLKLLQKCHYELYGICISLNGLLSLPLVLMLFFTGCELLFTCYMAFGKILTNEVVNMSEISIWITYILYGLFRVFCVLKAFSSIEGSGNATPYYVNGLLLKTEESEAQKELMKFSQQLLHQKISFTTSGLFNLDMSLLVSMTGAITTYLVILLQFSEGKNVLTFLTEKSETADEI